MVSLNQLSIHARRRLKKIRAAALLWDLLRKTVRAARYCLLRLIAHAVYPVLGNRGPLRGYYDRTLEFLQYGGGRHVELEPWVGEVADDYKPEEYVAIIPKARSIWDSGVIVSPDHRLISDVSWEGDDLFSNPLDHPAMHKLLLPPIRHIAGRVAIINSLMSDNYYHWMFDILPRFGILQRSALVPDHYLVSTKTPFQKESLQILGIPLHQILSPTTDTQIEADELIVPSLTGPVFRLSPQPPACHYLRSIFSQDISRRKPYRYLYITRNDAANRRVINEAEVQEEVRDNGFEVISLSNTPVVQQAKLFSEAKIIIGPHGAGFTNAVFCQPGSTLIEFKPERRKVDCFERLARFVGLEYHLIAGIEHDINDPSDDFTVDRDVVRRLLRQLA